MKYFISDTHFGHKNIIRYDGRPFSTVEEMDATIIENINDCYSPGDMLFHLGDFAFVPYRTHKEDLQLYRDRIIFPEVHLILGNHDYKYQSYLKRLFTSVRHISETKICPAPGKHHNTSVILCHYAMKVWNKAHYGSYHLYGHSHHSLPDDPNSLSFDIGVNGWDYKPLDENQIHEIMSKKSFTPIDHHRGSKN